MFQIAAVLALSSACLSIAYLALWSAPRLGHVTIRAPNWQHSRVMSMIQTRKQSRRQQALLSEMEEAEVFAARMLKSGVYTTHEILGVMAEMTVKLKPLFQRAYSRFFSCGTDAIEQMKQELPDEGFAVLCDALVFASSFGHKETAGQIQDHLRHLNQIHTYRRQRTIRQKEPKFVVAMVLSFCAFLAIQIYPWVMQALDKLTLIW
jgi:hypothetical protein